MSVAENYQTWAAEAACSQVSPDTLFVRGAAQRTARELCFGCPVRMACLAEALQSRTEFGVWGGLTERERRALLKRHPDVTDWAEWLAAAEHREEIPTGHVTRRRVAPATVAAG
ncbi:WhiB family transcriptional regulator [Georgenia subflava]|uniref:Transcriptional regulator WhiB n=1 Tax=Georgenia subflava TaxID=1622177 RepID=A0A6N7EPD5_9MICO|nr:WhiB family transcriptional regulator [Georgenia subflava]MPV37094.1 WhiB family transcriptional regulator [Georgenia subflava]